MTFVKTALFHKAGEGSGGGGGGGDQHNLGWYATESALTTAHPTASNGDWAIVGATDTVWVWDSDSTGWKDTGQAGIELPDQTGQSGKFLTTNGTAASWGDALANNTTNANSVAILGTTYNSSCTKSVTIGAGAVVYNYDTITIGYNSYANGYYGIAIGSGARSFRSGGIAIGYNANAGDNDAVIIGRNASAGDANCANSVAIGSGAGISGDFAIAIGPGAKAYSARAIQLGPGTNSDTGTLKVAVSAGKYSTPVNYELMSVDGTIPTARLTKVNSTITLTAAGWSNGSQTVTVSGVTSSSIVWVSPDPTDQSAYTSAGILCTAQGTDSLTFAATTTPSADIDVVVVAM